MSKEPSYTWEEAVLWLKSRPDQQPLVNACFYDDPIESAAERYWRSTEWTAVKKYLSTTTGTALDIGAGRGIAAFALSRDGWDVTALEPNPSAVVGAGAIRQLSRNTQTSIRIVETWGENLPFPDNSFDLVHCRQVLHHARDLKELCHQIGRVLKPGGIFIASREHVISQKSDLNLFLNRHPLHHLYGGEHAYLLSEYRSAIRAAGVQLTQVLNPLASDINLFPRTAHEVKQHWARKLRFNQPQLIPNFMLRIAGFFEKNPGRLYTFVGNKRF